MMVGPVLFQDVYRVFRMELKSAVGMLREITPDVLKSVPCDVTLCKPQQASRFGPECLHKCGGPVPLMIHHIWRTRNLSDIPKRWRTFTSEPDSKVLNGSFFQFYRDFGFVVRVWSDQDVRELIQTKFPWFLSQFDGYKTWVQRVDVAKYFILLQMGGMYVDLDILPAHYNWTKLFHFDFLLPKTSLGVSNDLMVSRPGHPFLHHLVRSLPESDHSYGIPYLTVMFSTGPLFVTIALSTFEGDIDTIAILGGELYGGSTALFIHRVGGSWHTLDSKIFWNVYRHRGIAAVCLLMSAVCSWLLRSLVSTSMHKGRLALTHPYEV